VNYRDLSRSIFQSCPRPSLVFGCSNQGEEKQKTIGAVTHPPITKKGFQCPRKFLRHFSVRSLSHQQFCFSKTLSYAPSNLHAARRGAEGPPAAFAAGTDSCSAAP